MSSHFELNLEILNFMLSVIGFSYGKFDILFSLAFKQIRSRTQVLTCLLLPVGQHQFGSKVFVALFSSVLRMCHQCSAWVLSSVLPVVHSSEPSVYYLGSDICSHSL
jgi:hypothetical protein